MTAALDILAVRIPQHHESVARIYDEGAKLWGIDLDPARFAELSTALDAGQHDSCRYHHA